MVDRINPVKETYSPISKAMYEFEKARNDLEKDLPGFIEVIDKHEALVRLRLSILEQRLLKDHGRRQKIIKIGIGTAALVILFPPFSFRGEGFGHHFILSPPKLNPQNIHDGSSASMDALGLLAIIAGITLLTWAATLVKWE